MVSKKRMTVQETKTVKALNMYRKTANIEFVKNKKKKERKKEVKLK